VRLGADQRQAAGVALGAQLLHRARPGEAAADDDHVLQGDHCGRLAA
jgi:hypothetical protein